MIRRHPRRGLASLLAAATLLGVLFISPSPSSAALDPNNLPPIPECSTDLQPPGALFTTCIELHLTSGSAKFGAVEATFDDPILVREVVAVGLVDGQLAVIPVPEGSSGVSFPEVVVPGGLFGGVPILENINLGPLTNVSATIIPAGPLTFTPPQIGALLTGNGLLTTATIPLTVRVNNTLLGNTCTIGSAASPITLNLALNLSGGLINAHFAELNASDTTFAIPAASGCGPLGTGPLLKSLKLGLFDNLVNQEVGLPSPSGNNHLTFNGVFAAKAVGPA